MKIKLLKKYFSYRQIILLLFLGQNIKYCPLKFKTLEKMTLFNVMTGSNSSAQQKGILLLLNKFSHMSYEVVGGFSNHKQSLY